MSTEKPLRILIVEDDQVLGKTVKDNLSENGFLCDLAMDGATAVGMVQQTDYKLIILDLALEDDSGLGVLRCVHEARENASIILITPLSFRLERQAGLEAGADDFVLKPFSMNELRARIDAAVVRSRTRPKSQLELGPLKMDLTARRVTRSDRLISLTPTEFRILEILLRNQGKVVTRRMLCEFLWNPDWEGVTNVIEVHINRLRSKMTREGEVKLIHTVRGSGYVLRYEVESADEVEVEDGQPVSEAG